MIFAAMALMAASCTNESVEQSVEQQADQVQVPVTVHVKGFSVSQEKFSGPITRAAQDVADYSGISSIVLAFYASNGTEAYKSTQAKGDADFGEFSLSLPMGSYTMVAVAYYHSDASPLVLTSPTEAAFTGHRAYETFATTQAVVINNTNAVDISATLNRVVTQLKVVSTDGKTADVSNVRMTNGCWLKGKAMLARRAKR